MMRAERLGPRLPVLLIVLYSLVFGCAEPLASPPSPPRIEMAGVIEEVHISDPDRTYVLVDGRRWEGRVDQVRVVMDWGGGQGDLFVSGSDAEGQFIALLGHQDGLPADCHFTPDAGIERGRYVQIRGILWPKSSSFKSTINVPSPGQSYPGGTRFCFDDRGEVVLTLP